MVRERAYVSATDFYLYFPTEDGAQAAGEFCRAEGNSVDVRLGADDVNWLTLVRRDVDRADFDAAECAFEDLARRFGGEYDGFEVDA